MFQNLRVKQFFLLYSFTTLLFAQNKLEHPEPAYIKTVIFGKPGETLQFPLVRLDEFFQLQFDDLNADERNYYYKIKYFNHDWTPSNLFQNEYMRGFDNLRIENYQTSFNTLQPYTHYQLLLPKNHFYRLKIF